MNSCRSSVEKASGSKFPRRSYVRGSCAPVGSATTIGVLERGSGTSGSQPSGSGSISATAPPLSATTRTSSVPSSRTVDACSASAPSTVSSTVLPAEGVAESSHEPPRLATVPGRSNSTDPLGTWTTIGPAWVPRRRVSRGTDRLAASSVAPWVHAATTRAATDSATISFLGICDLPFGGDRASTSRWSAFDTTTPRVAGWFPGTRQASAGSARWIERQEEGRMRRRRWIVAAMLVAATFARAPVAWADGGAYLDLDRTHYLPGQTARVEGYVSIPRAKQDLIERGPFYVFVVPPRTAVTEGRPIPGDAVRVGTVSIERDRGTTFELRGSFVVPELAGRSYGLYICNEPCTISGFREPLTGTISIVATAREGELLREVSRLNGRTWSLRRQVRKAERANLEARGPSSRIAVAEGSQLASRIHALEADEGAGTAAHGRAAAVGARLVGRARCRRSARPGARAGGPAKAASRARRTQPDRTSPEGEAGPTGR